MEPANLSIKQRLRAFCWYSSALSKCLTPSSTAATLSEMLDSMLSTMRPARDISGIRAPHPLANHRPPRNLLCPPPPPAHLARSPLWPGLEKSAPLPRLQSRPRESGRRHECLPLASITRNLGRTSAFRSRIICSFKSVSDCSRRTDACSCERRAAASKSSSPPPR